jgi:hypothetical protein
MSDINTSPKAISYRIYKTSISDECYLSLSMPYKYKRALANFRCSGHDLKIETGRHLNIDREFRFCSFCLKRNVYVVENEVHF